MTKHEMLHLVQSQFATDMNCMIDDLNCEKDSFVFTEAKNNPGRRPFPRNEQHFEMLSMGKAIIVSASQKILDLVKPHLNNKSRDEAFFMPFVYGHSLYYLPDLTQIKLLTSPDGYVYEMLEQKDIPTLYQYEGFNSAVSYDINHPRPDILVTLAKKDGRIVGMAGASKDCDMMWQVGIDVLPEYRNQGLGMYLVNWLTLEIVNRRFVPYYGTASSNIASQRVAHHAGYFPVWVCAYKGRFNGIECLPTA